MYNLFHSVLTYHLFKIDVIAFEGAYFTLKLWFVE